MTSAPRTTSSLAALTLLVVESAAHAAPAEASRTVVVLADDAREGLVDALRIQLQRGARIQRRPFPRGATEGERSTSAASSLSQVDPRGLAIWVDDPSPPSTTVTYHLLSLHPPHQESVRVEAPRPEELDRAMALKAREALESLPLERRAPPAPSLERDGAEVPRIGPVIELGGFGATPASSGAEGQIGVAGGVGLGVRVGRLRGEVVGVLRVPTSLDGETDAGAANVDELGLGARLWIGGAAMGAAVSPGGFVSGGLRWLDAEGVTRGGARGVADATLGHLSLGPDVRVRVAGPVEVRGALGLDVSFGRRAFALNGVPTLEVGGARGCAEVGISATFF